MHDHAPSICLTIKPTTLSYLVASIYYFIVLIKCLYVVRRDIPMPLVTSGVEYGNLRERCLLRMKEFGSNCRDIRTREVGIQEIHKKIQPHEVS